MNNSGKISGNITNATKLAFSLHRTSGAANGISSSNKTTNTGIIEGKVKVDSFNTEASPNYYQSQAFGNGIASFQTETLVNEEQTDNSFSLNVKNDGVIHGSAFQGSSGSETKSPLAGNGIYFNASSYYEPGGDSIISVPRIINNTGVIKGTNAAIYYVSTQVLPGDEINNYGILAGSKIFGNQEAQFQKDISGIKVTIDTSKGANSSLVTANSIENGSGGIANNGKEVINAEIVDAANGGKDSFMTIVGLGTSNGSGGEGGEGGSESGGINGIDSYGEGRYRADNKIFNGAGMESGTFNLVEGASLHLTNSIVNAYNTAAKLSGRQESTCYDENNDPMTCSMGAHLDADNTTFNGGGLLNDVAVIELTDGTMVSLTGNSVVNGSILASGNSTNISIGNSVTLNGDLISTGDYNYLNLGSAWSDGATDWGAEDSTGYGPLTGVTGPTAEGVDPSDCTGNAACATVEHKDVASGNLKLFHNISGFSDVRVDGRVTAYETARIADGNVNIARDGQLVVRVDGTQADANGRITGHFFEKHKGSLSAEGVEGGYETQADWDYKRPQLIFRTSGLGWGAVIAMNDTDISGIEDYQVDSWSILNTIRKTKEGEGNGAGKDFILEEKSFNEIFAPTVKPVEPPPVDPDPKPPVEPPPVDPDPKPPVEPPPVNPDPKPPVEPPEPKPPVDCQGHSKPYCDIYESIKEGGELPNLTPTGDADDTEENRKKELLSLLDQVYENNPYVQSSKLSYQNFGLTRGIIFETKMPDYKEWITSAHVLGMYDKIKDKRNVTVERTSIDNEYMNKLSIAGLLAIAEYGIRPESSFGMAVSVTNQKADLQYNNKLDGVNAYIGFYGKRKVDNFTFTAGWGYSFGRYDGTRTIINKYQTIENTGVVRTNSFDIYGESKYTYHYSDTFKIEPRLRLSQSFIIESTVAEHPSNLAIDMNERIHYIPAVEVGVDFVKINRYLSGDLELKAKTAVERSFGHKTSFTTGRIKGSTDFDILNPRFQRTTYKLGGVVDYELKNGVFYKAELGFNASEEVKINTNANIGIGYRF